MCGYVQRGDAVPAGVDRHLAGLHERGDGGSLVRGGGAVQPEQESVIRPLVALYERPRVGVALVYM